MKEAYYFSHDSNARSDSKIIKLRAKLGWKGYGIYWALIELLRDANDYALIKDYDTIAFELRCSKEEIKSIIEDYDLFELTGTTFYSTSLKRRMELREAKSTQAREAAQARWAKREQSGSNADALPTDSVSNAIKGKEIKEKEKKLKEQFEQFWDLYDKKTDRKNCLKKFKSLKESEIQLILEHVPKYVQANKDRQYRKNPLTYLRGECWNDEIEQPVLFRHVNPAL